MWSDLTDRRRVDDVLQMKLEENAQLIDEVTGVPNTWKG